MSKTIIVTGASRGIGLECARILLEKFNANVVTLSRSVPDELNKLKKKHDARIEIVQGDVSSETDQKVRVGQLPA
jgi:NAD(P)-dependent dehydrogenase (short-subunit alcohol dehydrogenase family)